MMHLATNGRTLQTLPDYDLRQIRLILRSGPRNHPRDVCFTLLHAAVLAEDIANLVNEVDANPPQPASNPKETERAT